MIDVVNLYKKYKKRPIFENVNIHFENKGLYVIEGESGIGKSTFLNIIFGVEGYSSGTIKYGKYTMTNRTKKLDCGYRLQNIEYIRQDYNLFDNLTVHENLSLFHKIMELNDGKMINEKIEYVLKILNVQKTINKKICTLSSGEKIRVSIAKCLIRDVRIILLDEPTANLDEKNAQNVMNILKTLSKNRLVIVVMHDKFLARKYADKLLLIKNKKVVSVDNNSESIPGNKYIMPKLRLNKQPIISLKKIFLLEVKRLFNGSYKKIFSYLVLSISSLILIFFSSTILGSLNMPDTEILEINKDYIILDNIANTQDFLNIAKDYIFMPSNSIVNLKFSSSKFYQFNNQNFIFSGSLTDVQNLNKENIVYGSMPTCDTDIVIDNLIVKKLLYRNSMIKNIDINSKKDLVGIEVEISPSLKLKISGISDTESPNIFINKKFFNYILYENYHVDKPLNIVTVNCFNLTIKMGRTPQSENEILINSVYMDNQDYINYIKNELNFDDIYVSGYYESYENDKRVFLHDEKFGRLNLNDFKKATIISDNITDTMKYFKDNGYYPYSVDATNKKESRRIKKTAFKRNLKSSIPFTILSITLVFIAVSTELTKEKRNIKTARFIGIMEKSVIKYYFIRSLLITTIFSVPPQILAYFLIKKLSSISIFKGLVFVNLKILFLLAIFEYIKNITLYILCLKRIK